MKEEFDLTRTEVRNAVNAADTRPLTDQERAALAAYLQPATNVVINDEIRRLAASITGGETNPVSAARKLYDWTYKNVRNKVDYYFGNLDERRVVWSTGRDLTMQPPEDDGPVNSLPKMYVEVDGKQFTDWTRQFTYKETGKE